MLDLGSRKQIFYPETYLFLLVPRPNDLSYIHTASPAICIYILDAK